MRRSLGADLAAAVAIAACGGGTVAADPSVPQLSPLHRQREDAQRLIEQHRGHDQPPSSATATGTRTPATPQASGGGGRHTTRGVGLALLGVAGLSAIIALPLLTVDNPGSDGQSSDDSLGKLLLASGALTGALGLVLVLSDRSVAVTPTVSPGGAGIAITGRM